VVWMHESSSLASAGQWAVREFSGAVFPDKRLGSRLINIATSLAAHPRGSLPEACGDWKRTKGAYRFFDNRRVTAAAILEPHKKQTLTRMNGQKTVLVLQDTTALNFTAHPATTGLGLIGVRRSGTLGLWLHSSLAFTPQGEALGVVDLKSWSRDPKDFGKAKERDRRPLKEKESHRWLESFEATAKCGAENPGVQFVNIADREGDVYDLFVLANKHPEVGVLVRSSHDRKNGAGRKLGEILAAGKAAGVLEVTIGRKPGVAARTARMSIKYAAVDLRPPGRNVRVKTLPMWVVEAEEEAPAESGRKRLHWRLVTNVPVTDLKSAIERVEWYRQRWSIEEFHRILKSGCLVEERQLQTREGLDKIIRLDMLVAWRVLELTRAARKEEGGPAREYFGGEELSVLKEYYRKKGGQKTGEITLKEAVRRVAQLGGFLARKSDGEPGSMTLWRGLQKLAHLTEGYRLAKSCG
jgi:hypothetical protein